MYINKDVEIFLQDECTELSIRAWNEEYLHVYTQDNDDYDITSMLLSKEQVLLLRDTLGVFLKGGYVDE